MAENASTGTQLALTRSGHDERRGGDRPQFGLVVPVFNEEDRLDESGAELARFVSRFAPGSELIIADDGSSDATLEVAHELQHRYGSLVRVVELPHQGKGATLRQGLLAARTAYVGFCDVDLATPLSEVDGLLRAATTGPVVTIASRDVLTTTLVETEGPVREFLGKAFNRLVRYTVTPGIHDTQCGAKVASRPVWQQILRFSREDGFAWDVGVAWAHDDRSRVRPLRDGLAMVRAVPRIWETARSVAPLTDRAVVIELVPRTVHAGVLGPLPAALDA